MPKQEKVKINVKDRVEDKTIDLSLSEISEVPVKDIAAFKRATILDLSSNKIISLGKNFGTLSHLIKLDLSKNQIRFLPDDFGNLKNLKHLDLFNNRIEHLPLSFGNLVNLRYLDLKTNPLTPPLAKIVGQCLTTKDCSDSAKNTVKFLAEMQKEVAKEKLKREVEVQAIEELKRNETQQKAKQKNKKKNKGKKSKDQGSGNNAKSVENCDSSSDGHEGDFNDRNQKSNSVFKTILIFSVFLFVNIIAFYIATVKNLEIADYISSAIPAQYRDKILFTIEESKLNFLKISDWLQKFISPAS